MDSHQGTFTPDCMPPPPPIASDFKTTRSYRIFLQLQLCIFHVTWIQQNNNNENIVSKLLQYPLPTLAIKWWPLTINEQLSTASFTGNRNYVQYTQRAQLSTTGTSMNHKNRRNVYSGGKGMQAMDRLQDICNCSKKFAIHKLPLVSRQTLPLQRKSRKELD